MCVNTAFFFFFFSQDKNAISGFWQLYLKLSSTSLAKQLLADSCEDMENKGKQCSSYGNRQHLPLGLNKTTRNDHDLWMPQCYKY